MTPSGTPRTRRIAVTAGVSAVLVGLATAEVVWTFRLAAALLVATLVAAGQRWELSPVTGAGLLGLVVIVGTGPAADAGPAGLLVWALPTWVLVLVAAPHADGDRPAPIDRRTRLRASTGEVVVVAAAMPLAVVAATDATVAPVWAAATGGLVALLLVAAIVRRERDVAPTESSGRRDGGGWGI